MQRKYILLIIFQAWVLSCTYTQHQYMIQYDSKEIVTGIKQGAWEDSVSILKFLHKGISKYHADGYVTASIDKLKFQNDTCHIQLFKGPLYKIKKIEIDESTQLIINAAGLSSFKINNTTPDSIRINKYMNGILEFMIRNGHPFASVYLDDVQIQDGEISAMLKVDAGKQITFGEMDVQGRSIVSKNFLVQYLAIKNGQPYDHEKVLQIRPKIRDLPFVEEYEPPTVSFINEQAIINLPLKAKKSSIFDFIIGLAPSTENGVRKWNINGEFNGDVFNKFGQGERIQLKIKRLTAEDQSLFLAGSYPYLLNTPLGLEGEISIVRNRNKSVDVTTKIGAQYILSGNETAKVHWNLRSSRLTAVDTARLISTRRLPSQLDYDFKGGGLTYQFRNVDYKFNPKKGWEVEIGLDAGVRSIVKNSGIQTIKTSQIDFSKAYDTLSASAFQVNGGLTVNKYFPVSNWAALKASITGGVRYNNGKVLENELYRIGGNKLLRGFDELSILTDMYAVFTTEFRIILDQNSFLSFPFIDVSRNRVYINELPVWDTAIGLGLGMNFATKAGIFNLAFSAGKRLENPFDFGKAKLHFGYVNLF